MQINAAARLLHAKKDWTFVLDGAVTVTVEALDQVGAWIALSLGHKEKLGSVTSVELK